MKSKRDRIKLQNWIISSFCCQTWTVDEHLSRTLSLASVSAPASRSNRTHWTWAFSMACINAVRPSCDSISPQPWWRFNNFTLNGHIWGNRTNNVAKPWKIAKQELENILNIMVQRHVKSTSHTLRTLSLAFILAPCSKSRLTHSVNPPSAADSSAVRPTCKSHTVYS